MPRITTMFSLIGSRPAVLRGERRADRIEAEVAPRDLRDAIGAQAVDAHVDAVEPGLAQQSARSRAAERRSSTARCPSISGTARSIRISSWICGRIVGSPPVMRNAPQPERRELSHDLGDLLVRQNLRLRQPLHPRLGHAVHAAEVAAIRDRDAEILDAAGRTDRRSDRVGAFGVMRVALGSPFRASPPGSRLIRARPTRAFRRRSARASRSARAA